MQCIQNAWEYKKRHGYWWVKMCYIWIVLHKVRLFCFKRYRVAKEGIIIVNEKLHSSQAMSQMTKPYRAWSQLPVVHILTRETGWQYRQIKGKHTLLQPMKREAQCYPMPCHLADLYGQVPNAHHFMTKQFFSLDCEWAESWKHFISFELLLWILPQVSSWQNSRLCMCACVWISIIWLSNCIVWF